MENMHAHDHAWHCNNICKLHKWCLTSQVKKLNIFCKGESTLQGGCFKQENVQCF